MNKLKVFLEKTQGDKSREAYIDIKDVISLYEDYQKDKMNVLIKGYVVYINVVKE